MKIDVTAKEIRVVEKDGRTCFEVDGEEYAPVRHGRWIREWNMRGDISDLVWSCSVCGMPKQLDTTKYCPNCGARMDGETDE